MGLKVLSGAEKPHLFAVQTRTLTPSHCGDRLRAITIAAPLFCPHNSTSRRAQRPVRDAVPARQHDRVPPPSAQDATAATPPDLPVGGQVLFLEFFNDRGRADVQHPRRIANAAGIHGHIDDLLLDVR